MLKVTLNLIFFVGIWIAPKLGYSLPPWAKNNQQRLGNLFFVVCKGEGPSIDIARVEAMDSCKATASDQYAAVIKVQSIELETNNDLFFHQQISKSIVIENLNCVPTHEKIEEQDESYNIWIRCKFDLTNATVIKKHEP